MKVIVSESVLGQKLSQKQMADMSKSFTYSLSHGYLKMIPISKIVGLDPEPASWVDGEGNEREFKKGTLITEPIEVIFDGGQYYLQNGNHRIKQAKVNGDKFIKAFVQF